MRLLRPLLVTVAVVIGLPLVALAQSSAPLPAEARALEAATDAALKIAVRPETAERIATFKKNLYDALLARGFTQQQAIAIVVAAPVPGLAPH